MGLIRFAMKSTVGFCVVCILIAYGLGSCKATNQNAKGKTTDPTTADQPKTPGTSKTETTVPVSAGDVDGKLAALPVAEPHKDGYKRELFKHWSDLDGNGCDTRDDVLVAESVGSVTFKTQPSGCGEPVTGVWESAYDGKRITNAKDMDVDHMVPLANAWASGAWQWDNTKRELYANDVSYPGHLIAVSAASNRAKGDKSPDAWKPSVKDDWCQYATDWVEVKTRWQLTVTAPEKQALSGMLATCSEG